MLDGDPAPLTRGTAVLTFRSMSILAKGLCFKMPLGAEVDLGQGHIVLDVHPVLPQEGPCLLWPNGRPSQLLLFTRVLNSVMC